VRGEALRGSRYCRLESGLLGKRRGNVHESIVARPGKRGVTAMITAFGFGAVDPSRRRFANAPRSLEFWQPPPEESSRSRDLPLTALFRAPDGNRPSPSGLRT
jgi:hypothetical protein